MDTSKLVGLVVLGGIFYIGGQYIASQPQRLAQEVDAKREITVQGQGKVTATPDIGQLTVGLITDPQSTSAAASNQLGDKFTKITAALKQLGIKDEDIKATNLSVQPQYDYKDGQQVLRGYQANENVTVKIRDLKKVGDVVAQTTSQGANQIGDVQFTIDEPSQLQLQAQEAAIKDAQANAEKLAQALHVTLGRVKTFTPSNGSPVPPIMYAAGEASAQAADLKTVAPPVPSGNQEITASVSITYELR